MLNGETANEFDSRVDALWRDLGADRKGFLDLRGLTKGLSKIDHPLKYAETLLQDVLHAIDTDKDGKISYAEFHKFVRQTEQELWTLFQKIDRNGDGKLEQDELAEAFESAGVTVSRARLKRFFENVDSNHDGSVSFAEWRDFLLFIPASEPGLKEVISYFSASLKLTAEGDALVSDGAVGGIGNSVTTFLAPFFATFTSALASIYEREPTHRTHRYELRENEELEADANPQGDEMADENVAKPERVASEGKKRGVPLLTAIFPDPGYFVAGGLSGIVSRTTTAPLDRLKILFISRTDTIQKASPAAGNGAVINAIRGTWRASADGMKELWAAGGVRSLFAGNGLNIVKVMPESAIKFGTYEIIRRLCDEVGIKESASNRFIMGGCAGMVAQLSVYPLDTLKFRMQCETTAGGLQGSALIIQTAKKMWKAKGIRAFYRGMPMGVIGIFPYAAIDMGTFNYLKHRIAARNAKIKGVHEDDAESGSFVTACIGGFSGALGATIVYPLNLLRTRLQSQGTILHPRTYNGITDVLRQTIKGEGARGLFKGLTPNLMKVVPSVSITWVVYENCKKRMELP